MSDISLKNKSILLVITGGIAAYKSLELIRQIRKSGGFVRCILTKSAEQFVTPMSVSALCENEAFTDLWSLKNETEMGHIQLSREADLIVIAPASADFIAKMAHGLANDLASTMLLAADKDILIAPAMNHRMWDHPATQENIEKLKSRDVLFVGPEEGDMACGEYGLGRMSEAEEILGAIGAYFADTKKKPLAGKHALITSGPTYEPLDPVRFIGNRSSGKQGHEIARALSELGAAVTLVSGPASQPAPEGITVVSVETADEMLHACENALPADIAICAAAVCDWKPAQKQEQKSKKETSKDAPTFDLVQTPDILAHLSQHKTNRPQLVIGFAAETENLIKNAKDKRVRKSCDWLLANEVNDQGKGFGADDNHVHLITEHGEDDWKTMSKRDIAKKLALKIVEAMQKSGSDKIVIAAE